MSEKWITVKEAGEILNISERQVINRIHRGKLKARKDGRLWLIHNSLSEAVPVTEETSEEATSATEEIPHTSEEAHKRLEEMVEILKKQVEEKDQQISQLHQLLMASERRQQLLEDKRKEPFYRRWFHRGKSEDN